MITLTPKLRKQFEEIYKGIKSGELKTLIPLLSLFELNNKTMTLEYHYQLAPMFNVVQPKQCIFMLSRQNGKSVNVCTASQMRSILIPGYHQVIVQPQMEMVARLNNTIYQPLLRACKISRSCITSTELNKFSLKTFKNGSMTYMEHAYMSPDRLRGISGAAACLIDECQDLNGDFIPIITECMSASINWGFSIYTGTPKTTDTTLALLWNQSSQAEWVIPCHHCNYSNIPNPDQDLLNMIGKNGPICAKCGKPVNIADGGWMHAYPSKMRTFSGYHLAQVIHPIHSINENKWSTLLNKVETYQEVTLYNEVFGWPYDASTSPLTLSDLVNAEYDPVDQYNEVIDIKTPNDVRKVANRYRYICVSVDWSGGGAISDSYTAYAVLGMRPDGQVIDVLYGKRIPKGVSPTEEAEEIMKWIRGSGANSFAFDNGGAGFTRLEIMKHAGLLGIDGLTVIPINYVRPRSGDVMKPSAQQRDRDYLYYTLDKSRSLAMCIMAIKTKRLRFRRFKHDDEHEYVRDFLALIEDPRETLGNETVILIGKRSGVPDDFAHAVNFGCSSIWDHFDAYPRIGSKYEDASQLEYDQYGNKVIQDEFFGPRSDFDKFTDALRENIRPIVIESDSYF